MAAAGGVTIFNVISVVSAAIGLVGFLQSNFPANQVDPMDSSVRIAVALNGDEGVPGALRHAGGESPLIIAFNENRHYCGSGEGHRKYIQSGSFRDIRINQKDYGPGEQATALQIIPTTNELCIAYIGQTWADGSHRGWVGDMGKACQRDWYHSNIIVGVDHKPTCTWIDYDHSHGITTGALQIRMQDFQNITGDYNKDPGFYCRFPTMFFRAEGSFYPPPTFEHPIQPLNYWDPSILASSASTVPLENDGVGEWKKPKSRRHNAPATPLKRRMSGLAGYSHMIASPHDRHSARELCEHDMSHGPDFVSFSEGVFCDMDAKVWWPLCNGTGGTTTGMGEEGCYHWDTHSLVVGGERGARNYSRVEEWE